MTGSRLRRTDAETPSPVQVITRDVIARLGAVSLNDVLQGLPANNTGAFNEADTVNNYGAAAVSLRGLGPGSTLVLINGRRVAPFGFTGGATFVDLNQIPVSAIDRIEVLLDGASAIYGSDAIAGVVNVILRRDFRGVDLSAGYGRSTHGDATQREASITTGVGDRSSDGYNVFATFSHADQDPVKATARWHSRTADYRGFGLGDFRSSYAYPGNLYSADNSTFLQPLPGCATTGEAGSALAGRCVYDPANDSDLIVGSRRDALFVAGSAGIAGGFELFGDAIFNRNVFQAQHSSFGSATYFSTGTLAQPFIPLPVGHPQNPYPFDVALRTRFADEPLFVTPTTETTRIVAGMRHHELAGWDVESALLWSDSRTRTKTTGVIRDSVLAGEVLDAGGQASAAFQFGNPAANDPALMERLYPTLVDTGRTSTASFDVRGTREIFTMPSGAAQLAVGVELRRESYSSAFDPLTTAGDISVIFGNTAAGQRTIASTYGELSLPLAKALEASIAARVDHYSDFGTSTNPKVGVKWKASPAVALRATYATAFRAPSLSETTQLAVGTGFAIVRDPVTCPVPDPSNPNCELAVQAISGGNPALRPERARSATAGVILEPWRDTSFTVDAFRIDRRDQIAYIDPTFLLTNESLYPGYVVRNADGTIDHLNLQYTNLASSRVWGVDVSGRARTTVADIGRVGVEGSYEWLPHFWLAQTSDAPMLDYAGTYTQPKSRARVALTFDRGAWQSALTFNYTGGYLRASSPSDLSCPYDASGSNRPELCSVKSWQTVDLFVGYRGVPNLELGFLIQNIDNVQAPFDERQVLGPFTAYQSAFQSAVGRFFKLTATYAFR
ncbi:MAG TPA: TonB-dependent receptor [Caldimonas sp.]|nr:TonB-dependent receptor [Caldimonas sp.]HEX4234407.1 TonB-dependent receptor [Caldimonas sp.]